PSRARRQRVLLRAARGARLPAAREGASAMSAPLLFEIGVEELPASFVAGALEAMPELAKALLAQARLAHGDVRALGTPRRLALLVDDLADRQADLSEKVLGPPKAAAFEPDGTPKKA